MGTVIVFVILAGMVAFVVGRMIRNRKNGKPHCSGDCSGCGGHCR